MTSRLARVFVQVILIVMTLIVLFPICFMIVNSLKTQEDFASSALSLPDHFTLSKYVSAFRGRSFGTLFLNSVLISVGSVAIATAAGAIAAYALARFRFWGRERMFGLMLPLMVLPPIVLLIPEFKLIATFGLINTRTSVVLLYAGIMLPFTIYLLRNFFVSFPDALIDAALIDGCNQFQAFYKVVLPLALPGLVTASLVNFVFAWNELLIALVFLQSEELRTLMVGVSLFKSRFTLDVPQLMAGLTISTIPIVILYLLGQRSLVEGLLSGSVNE
jgi:ABC-type glycerol-3-phosphate transport system permease component